MRITTLYQSSTRNFDTILIQHAYEVDSMKIIYIPNKYTDIMKIKPETLKVN